LACSEYSSSLSISSFPNDEIHIEADDSECPPLLHYNRCLLLSDRHEPRAEVSYIHSLDFDFDWTKGSVVCGEEGLEEMLLGREVADGQKEHFVH
jgi:hypothetical protein